MIDELAASFDWNKLVIAVDVQNNAIDWHLVAEDLVSWANSFPLPRAQNINEKRVRMALPTPPQYSLASVQAAMWVLECDESSQQGTAFDLVGYGTVTNAHVVEGTSNIRAFRADKPTETFAVSIKKQNQALDLAIIAIEGGSHLPRYMVPTTRPSKWTTSPSAVSLISGLETQAFSAPALSLAPA